MSGLIKSWSPWKSIHTMHTGAIKIAAIVAVTLLLVNVSPAQAESTHPYDSHARKTVTVGVTKFDIDLVKIDLRNPKLKVKTYTGTNGTVCYLKSCPTKSLKAYLDEGKGFAAINGTYFCPADYKTCGPAGNYYWTVFNYRNRKYVNPAQNRFNHRGAMLTFDANGIFRFYRDTGTYPYLPQLHGQPAVDPNASVLTAAISNGPTFINDGAYVLTQSEIDTLDYKSHFVKTTRGGIGIRGTMVYLVIARKATVPDLGKIMRSMKLDYAMNLDGGGSSALWYRGAYKVGPGRNLPNAIVFSEK